MKQKITLLLLFVSIVLNAQISGSPTTFGNGIKLQNATEDNSSVRIPVMTNNGTINTYTNKGLPNGLATLDPNGKVPLSQISDALLGAVNYQGTWNASTNTPTLIDPTDSSTKGYYYTVNVAGTQFGNEFEVGDWVISNGANWQKVDNNNKVTSVFGRIGDITALQSDYDTFFYTKTESDNNYLNKNTGGIVTGDITVSKTIPSNIFNDNSTNSYARYYKAGANFYIQSGANGSGTSVSSGSIYFTGYGSSTTPLGGFYVRDINGFQTIFHSGNLTPSDYLNKTTGGTITGTTTYDKTIAEIDAASPKSLVNNEYLQDYVANNSGGATNLSYTSGVTNGTVTSDTGTNAVIPTVTSSFAGLQKPDFYEEGTFTPTVTAGVGATYTYTVNNATYKRVGNLVHIVVNISMTSTSGTPSGGFFINNLPFSHNNQICRLNISQISNSDISASDLDRISLQSYDSDNTSMFLKNFETSSFITAPTFTAGVFEFSGTYITNIYTP